MREMIVASRDARNIALTRLIHLLVDRRCIIDSLSSSTQNDKTFIYGLKDPDSGIVRYIGKANNPQVRLYRHLREKRKSRKNSWLQSLKAKGLVPEIVIIEEVLVTQWQERERYWIAFYREQGFDLVNGTDGGDGVHGMHHTVEAKRKIGAVSEGNQYSKGRIPTTKQRECAREAAREKVWTAESRAKLGAKHKNKVISEATRSKYSEANTGRARSVKWYEVMRGEQSAELVEKRIAPLRGRKRPSLSKQARKERAESMKIDRDQGMSYAKIGQKYGVSGAQVRRIILGE